MYFVLPEWNFFALNKEELEELDDLIIKGFGWKATQQDIDRAIELFNKGTGRNITISDVCVYKEHGTGSKLADKGK